MWWAIKLYEFLKIVKKKTTRLRKDNIYSSLSEHMRI